MQSEMFDFAIEIHCYVKTFTGVHKLLSVVEINS